MGQLRLISAIKAALRTQTPDLKNSIWEFKLIDDETGEVHKRLGEVKSVKEITDSEGVRRTDRNSCNPIHGATSVLKPVHWLPTEGAEPLDHPKLMLKLPNSEVYRRRGAAFDALQNMFEAARLMRVQGIQSYAGTRIKPSGASEILSDEERTCHFLVVENLDQDLLRLGISSAAERIDVSSDAGIRSLSLAMAKLMAFVQFFHEQFGRGIIDIKPENIMPIINKAGQIVSFKMIDIESSLGRAIAATMTYQRPVDIAGIIEELAAEKEHQNPSRICANVDFRTLSTSMAVAMVLLQESGAGAHNLIVEEKTHRHTLTSGRVIGQKYYHFDRESSQRNDTIVTGLLFRMLRCNGQEDARNILVDALQQGPRVPGLGPQLLRTYDESLKMYKDNYVMDVAMTRAGFELAAADQLPSGGKEQSTLREVLVQMPIESLHVSDGCIEPRMQQTCAIVPASAMTMFGCVRRVAPPESPQAKLAYSEMNAPMTR